MELTIIELPAYYKDIVNVYKVYSSKKCLKVCYSDGNEGIDIVHASLPFEMKAPKSTEQEFKEMFNLINAKLCTL